MSLKTFYHTFGISYFYFSICCDISILNLHKIIPEKRKIYSSLVKIIGSDVVEWATKTNIEIVMGFQFTKGRTYHKTLQVFGER